VTLNDLEWSFCHSTVFLRVMILGALQQQISADVAATVVAIVAANKTGAPAIVVGSMLAGSTYHHISMHQRLARTSR